MVDRDILLEKTNQIQNCLKRIADKTGLNPDSLDDLDIQEIFVLNLQRAVQAALDIAAHIGAEKGYGLAEDFRTHFTLLEKNGLLPKELAERLRKMAGFRNIAIHDYSRLDSAILKNIIRKKSLKDIEDFYDIILKTFITP